MKRLWTLLLFVCLVAAGLLCLLSASSRVKLGAGETVSPQPVSTTNNVPAQQVENPGVSGAPWEGSAPALSPSANPQAEGSAVDALAASGEPEMPPATVLENVRTTIRQYGSMFGGNPVGTNPEITSALNGANPKHVKFLRPDAGLRVNEKGELVDAWGTPYFFHQLSGTEMEIRSAGPDKIMWTADDLVLR